MNDIQRRERLATLAKWGLGFTLCVLLAPIAFLAVKGLIGAILFALIASAAIFGGPVVEMKLKNWRVKAIKQEAKTNPIETLQVQYQDQQRALEKFSLSITDFATEVANFGDRVQGFRKRYPEDAPKFEAQLQKMEQLLDLRQNKYREAQRNLEAFRLEIQKANAIWEMSLAAQAMNQAAGMQTGDVFEAIKTETAIDAVQSSLNRAFAELETSLLDKPDAHAPPMLVSTNGGQVVEVLPAVKGKVRR